MTPFALVEFKLHSSLNFVTDLVTVSLFITESFLQFHLKSHLQGMKAERSRFVFFQAGQVKKNAERILLSVN